MIPLSNPMKLKYICYLAVLLLNLGCSKDQAEEQSFWQKHVPFSLTYDVPSGLTPSTLFEEVAEDRGSSTMNEASGLAISIANPGYIWSHQDKNNENLLFLLDKNTGETVARYRLEGMLNRDWEDIEIGPGPVPGKTYIYLGDIGDNDRIYHQYTIYRFEEPVFDESHRGERVPLTIDFDAIVYRYPEGVKHDCETLLLDPWTKDLFVVSKRSFFSRIYVLPYPQNTSERMEAQFVGEFPFTRAVGGNISLDGKEMLIKTYDHILHWQRSEGENMVDMFTKEPLLAPYNPTEPQGEAICFNEDKSYYTLSEFSNSIIPVLYFYQRKN